MYRQSFEGRCDITCIEGRYREKKLEYLLNCLEFNAFMFEYGE